MLTGTEILKPLLSVQTKNYKHIKKGEKLGDKAEILGGIILIIIGIKSLF